MENPETNLTKKQLASKRNVLIAIAANAKRRKNYFKKKIVETKAVEPAIEEKSENIPENAQIVAQQPQIKKKNVSQLTLKRRRNKLRRQLMEDEQDNYIPQKRRFIRKIKIGTAKNIGKFLSQHDKEKFVFQLRRKDIDKVKEAITNGIKFNQNCTALSVLGPPGVGKTTSVLLAAEELGFKEQQIIIVHNLKLESWYQTFLSSVGVKASQKKSKQIFQQYIKPIKLFLLDEFDWMDPVMVSQILTQFSQVYNGVLVFIGCDSDILERIGTAKKYFSQKIIFFQYQTQQYMKIIQRLFPQLQPFRRSSMVRSFLLRSYDLRNLIQYIRTNKDSVINSEIVDKNAIKNFSDKANSFYLFVEEMKRRCKECTLTSFIIFMLQKSKKGEISLIKLAQPVEQNFTPNQILLKCRQLQDIGIITAQFRRRKQNEHRDWTKQDLRPTWYFKKAGTFAWLPKFEIISKFFWTDLIPFSKTRKSLRQDPQPTPINPEPQPTTPINESPVSNHNLQQMQLETQQLDLRIFSSDNDETPQQIKPEKEVIQDRYANLTANLSTFLQLQQKKIQNERKRIEQKKKPRIPDQMPKPRNLRGIPERQSDEQPEPNNFRGMSWRKIYG